MNDQRRSYPFRQATGLASLVLLILLLAGCSGTRPALTDDATGRCGAQPGELPIQAAPDACRKEACVDGRLTVVELLTETAAVSDWAEEVFCLFHPIDCIRALSVKGHIRQWEQDMTAAGFWDRASLQGGLGDAARHAYLGCLLTERFGHAFATGLLEAHEEDSTLTFGFGTGVRGNLCCNKLMDLHNNRVGAELAALPGDCEEKVMDSLHLLRHSLCGR